MLIIIDPAYLRSQADTLDHKAAELSEVASELQEVLSLIAQSSPTIGQLSGVADEMAARAEDFRRRATAVETSASYISTEVASCPLPDANNIDSYFSEDALGASNGPYGAAWIADVGYLRLVGDRPAIAATGWSNTDIHFVIADRAAAKAAAYLAEDGWPLEAWTPVEHPITANPDIERWVEAFAQEIVLRHQENVAVTAASGLADRFFAQTAQRVQTNADKLIIQPEATPPPPAPDPTVWDDLVVPAAPDIATMEPVGAGQLEAKLGVSDLDFKHALLGHETDVKSIEIYTDGLALWLFDIDKGTLVPTQWKWPDD